MTHNSFFFLFVQIFKFDNGNKDILIIIKKKKTNKISNTLIESNKQLIYT